MPPRIGAVGWKVSAKILDVKDLLCPDHV